MSATTELARREERAQGGIIQFAEEMRAIREGKLYPNAGQTDAWKTYCKERWGQSESNVRRTIQALPVLKRLSARGARAEIPVTAAADVAELPESVQDAILGETTYRDDVRAKAKAVRKVIRNAENEGREATVEELVDVVEQPLPKAKKPKTSKKHSRFTRYLAAALHETQNAADYAQGDVLSDTENDFAWTVVGRLEHQIERLKDKLFQPDHVRDVDAEFAELLGGDQS